ncbi:hypothetical protein A3Q56_03944 [Intoshia linei]|uniref:Uncharacterized protein n=1 Tax=Intoshia linei TaxID=1819745 RepID=A0A177B255_9BILA|nr:hypothetical protein A3Q56_03944 [Intoshia linei]
MEILKREQEYLDDAFWINFLIIFAVCLIIISIFIVLGWLICTVVNFLIEKNKCKKFKLKELNQYKLSMFLMKNEINNIEKQIKCSCCKLCHIRRLKKSLDTVMILMKNGKMSNKLTKIDVKKMLHQVKNSVYNYANSVNNDNASKSVDDNVKFLS